MQQDGSIPTNQRTHTYLISSSHVTLKNTDHKLSRRANFNKFQKVNDIQPKVSHHNAMKLEVQNIQINFSVLRNVILGVSKNSMKREM